ncbi:YfgM family protein [Chitinilyticum piscinae]|uniref:Ancillary SecYEG translocon subunit n=1 Tax=Chitinilyticum piscinae TaxID=2866724 RepID=A0A8J7KEJ1_9NEIS|nr:tetratricopeptide repeat protein [Chitinilyticum piscinae]MBE9609594.1 tetratricopeptide repeat protein [Chitinilyticum piscinae]
MAAFDLQEQEQLAQLKGWWQDWGRYLAAVLAAVLIGFIGWQGWQAWQRHVHEKAGAEFIALQDVVADPAKFKAQLDKLKSDYTSTPYASRGAMIAAQQAYTLGKLQDARAELKWVIDHSGESVLRDLARLRQAGIALDEKKFDEALSLAKAPEETSFSAVFAETRGDAYLLKGDKGAARDAYQQALAKTNKEMPNYRLIEFKLHAAGAQ